jgi:hypothetical protein
LKYSNEALLLAKSTNVSRDILVALKNSAVIEPKKKQRCIIGTTFISMKLQNDERKMGDRILSVLSMKQM